MSQIQTPADRGKPFVLLPRCTFLLYSYRQPDQPRPADAGGPCSQRGGGAGAGAANCGLSGGGEAPGVGHGRPGQYILKSAVPCVLCCLETDDARMSCLLFSQSLIWTGLTPDSCCVRVAWSSGGERPAAGDRRARSWTRSWRRGRPARCRASTAGSVRGCGRVLRSGVQCAGFINAAFRMYSISIAEPGMLGMLRQHQFAVTVYAERDIDGPHL